MKRGQGLARLYQTGGSDMLAYRLGALFTSIEKNDDEARVRHNDMLAEVLDLINKDFPRQEGALLPSEGKLLTFMAEYLLYRKVNRQKRFLFALGEQILHFSKLKG